MLAAMTPALAATAPTQPAPIPLDAAQREAFGLVLTAPAAADSALTRRYPARVAVPNRQLRVVSAPQAGVVESLLVAEGERVNANDVLAWLRSPDLVDAQSALLEASTRLALAESELTRDQMLHREGVIAERRLLESQSRRTELATLVEQQRQKLRLAGLSASDIEQLLRTRQLSSRLPVRTPIAGVVLEQMVDTGESLSIAAPLYRVAELSPLWVEVHVPVDQLGGLAPGGRVYLPALGLDGEIVTVGRMVHGEDQGVLVRAEVREGTNQLRPGQFIEVQLSAASAGGASWRLPAAAVVRHAGQSYVFVERAGGFVALPVRILAEEGQTQLVEADLTTADRVVIQGVVALKAVWLGALSEVDAETGAGAN
jgi:RND family efflux transporter MFP subunit